MRPAPGSEADLGPGGSAVRGEEQLAGALRGVGVADGGAVDHHAVGVGGEAQVGPARPAVRRCAPCARSARRRLSRTASSRRSRWRWPPRRRRWRRCCPRRRPGPAPPPAPSAHRLSAHVHLLDRVARIALADAEQRQPVRGGHRDRGRWACGGHGIGLTVKVRPPSPVTSTWAAVSDGRDPGLGGDQGHRG